MARPSISLVAPPDDPPRGQPPRERPSRGRPAGTPESAAAKRKQILDGARHVFLATGFDGASMGEVARASGVSKGTLYVYFDSKESLFEALTVDERKSAAEMLFELDTEEPDPRIVLLRLGRSFLKHLSEPDHTASVRMVIGAAHRFPQYGQAFYEAGPVQGTSRLSAYLERQVEAGRLDIADCELAAQQFLELCASGTLKKLLFGVISEPPPAAEVDRIVGNALAMFFAAYGPDRRAG